MIGHYFKVIAYYLIYKALIETGFVKPYNLLFRDLKQERGRVCAGPTSNWTPGFSSARRS